MIRALLITCLFFVPLFTSARSTGGENKDDIILVIDPGHGGKDYGRLASKSRYKHEKELNLDIAVKLGNYIERNLSHVKVIYTRTTDVYPTLDERVEFANAKNADYFISIHCNGTPNNPAARGTETHINTRENKASYNLALLIEKQFKTRAKRKSRGVKTSADRHHSLQVLKQTNMPSVLVEAGFMSNIWEEEYLNSTYGQELVASAIFRAFRTYVKQRHPNIDFLPNLDEGPYYRVQIMSSIDKVDTEIPEFVKLGVPVTRHEIPGNNMYKYKYTVGKTKDKRVAKQLMKATREKGFRDAFIVKY